MNRSLLSHVLRRSSIEQLEARCLLSASLSLGGTVSLSPTAPQALDQSAPVGGYQAESMTAVDPTNPLNVATVVTKYGFTTLEYYSHDGGKTWNWNDISDSGDDPCVAYDANGNLFVTYLLGGPHVLESTDKGVTFGANIWLVGQSGDKEMIATGVDPTTGRQALYVVYLNEVLNPVVEQVVGIRENDSGQLDTASTVTASLPEYQDQFGDLSPGFWGHPLVGPNGELYVLWRYGDGYSIAFTRDSDGLWGTDSTFAAPTMVYTSPFTLFRTISEPASPHRGVGLGVVAAIDANSGSLCVTWVQPRSTAFYNSPPNQDPTCSVVVSTCTDPDAASPIWSLPVAIDPIAAGTECTQFLPWLSVDPSSGDIFASYLTTDGNAAGDLADVRPRLAWSTDGGATWSKQNLTDLTSNVTNDASGYDYLEYMGLAVVDGTVHAAFTRETSTSDDLYGVNAAVVSSDGGNVLTVSGTAAADSITIKRDSTNPDYLDVVINGATAYSGSFASLDRISVLGEDGDDSLSIDASNGTAVPWAGLSYDGGSGSNSVGVLGDGGQDALSVASGQIAATGHFGSEIITFSNVAGISYTPDSGNHSLTVNGSIPVTIPRSTGAGIRQINFANLTIASGAKVVLASSATLGDYSNHANRSVAVIAAGGLSIATGGTLDMGDNDLILRYASADEITAVAQLRAYFVAGFDGASWDTPGIDSSESTYDSNFGAGTRALGYADNADLGYSSFDGVDTSDGTEVLAKFTYYGDSDLNGMINGTDFSLFGAGRSGAGTGWDFGDYDYSGGRPDGTDFSLFGAGLSSYRQFGAL